MYVATVPCITCGTCFVRYECSIYICLVWHTIPSRFSLPDLRKRLDVFDYFPYARFPTHRASRLRFCLFNGPSELLLHAIEVISMQFKKLCHRKIAMYFAFAQNAPLDIEKGESVHWFDCVCIFRQSFCIFVDGTIRLCVQYESECCDRNSDWRRLDRLVYYAAWTQAIRMENSLVPSTRWHFTIAWAKRFSAHVLGFGRTLAVASIDSSTNSIIIQVNSGRAPAFEFIPKIFT